MNKFSLGQTVATPNALEKIHPTEILQALSRHSKGDWGDCSEEDKKENEFALDKYLRLFSVYRSKGVKFWIITEADRSATTVLMPEDY